MTTRTQIHKPFPGMPFSTVATVIEDDDGRIVIRSGTDERCTPVSVRIGHVTLFLERDTATALGEALLHAVNHFAAQCEAAETEQNRSATCA